MKRCILVIALVFTMLCVFAYNDSESFNVTGYLIKDNYSRMISFNILDYNNSSVANGAYISANASFVGTTPVRMFSWIFSGNLNYMRNSGLQVKFTLSPLKLTTGNQYIAYNFVFNADYTYLDGTYLGANGADVQSISGSTVYRDTISPFVSNSQTVSGLSIRGSTAGYSSSQSIGYKYMLSSDPGSKYLWSRTGTISIAIDAAAYQSATPGTYRATITVEISAT